MSTTGTKIAAELESLGMSQRALAKSASIPETSLRRKIDGFADFTIPELERIIAALDIPASAVLPDSLTGGTR